MRKILSLLMLLLLTTAGSWAQEVHLVKRGYSTLLTADLAAKTAAGDLYVALQQHVVEKVGNKNNTYERYISGTGAMTPDFDYTNGTTTWKVIAKDDGYVLQNSTGSYLKNNGKDNPATTTANLAEATVYIVSNWGGNSTSMLVSGYNQNQALNWVVKNQNLRINTNSSTIIHNTGTGGYTKIFTYEVEKKTIAPISFNPNITYQEGRTQGGRYLNSIALQSSGRTQTISAGFTNPISSKQYLNLTNQHFTVGAGATVKPIINWTGAYMHGMVYIDLNGDGDFSTGENVANSALTGSPNLTTGIATFTAPAEPGDYLMRFKVDWADTAPAGSSSICANGGSITDVMLRVRNTANITFNITGDVTRNVPMNDLPEDTYDVATLLGAAMPSYITFTPSSITTSTTDETFNITCTQTLPFATDGTQYFMNMGGKYATTENTDSVPNSLQSTFLQIQNSYLWTFSGNAIDGFKLYNVGAGKYAKVNNSNNSVATFESEGDAPYFELSANSYSKGAVVGGYCLKLAGTTNCYLNDRDSKLSTWTDNRAANDYGSLIKFESLDSVMLAKLTALTNMTNYVGSVQAEALETGHAFKTKLDEVTANPTVAGYNEVITLAESYKVAPVDGGYYRIVSAYSRFPQEKAVYNDGGTMKWKSYAAEDASMVLKFIKSGDKWKIYVPSADAYMADNTGATTTDAASAANYTFTDLNNAVLNIYDGAGNLHANNHGEGTGTNGTLLNYDGGVGSASAWYVIRYGSEVSEDTLIAPYQTSVNTVYQTYATSDNVIVANPGVTVYKVTGVANEKANIVKAGTSVVPASTGVILSGERGKTFTMLRVTTDVASQYADNKLVQGDGTAKTDDFVLAYRENDTDAYFYKIGTLKIPTNRAYLPASSGNSTVAALALNFGDDDELTAIESLPAQAESAQGQAFDLQGRRVSKLQKGIYIVGGKKVMVK